MNPKAAARIVATVLAICTLTLSTAGPAIAGDVQTGGEPAFDPIPGEAPLTSAESTPATTPAPAPTEIVPFPPGTDPFALLELPTTPAALPAQASTNSLTGFAEPPPAGQTVAFPTRLAGPSEPAPATSVPELAVLEYSPRGRITGTGEVTVTFNQPIVALTSPGELASGAFPLEVEPQLPGSEALWLNPQTLVFRHAPQFPHATTFTFRIPAGTVAWSGKVLQQEVVWSITTAEPSVVQSSPSAGLKRVTLNPDLAITFNSIVDRDSAVQHVRLLSAGGKSVAIAIQPLEPELAALQTTTPTQLTPGQIRALSQVRFKPTLALLPDTKYRLVVTAGLRTTEGPLPMVQDYTTEFKTYGPLGVESFTCAPDSEESPRCRPDIPVHVVFSNELARQDLAQFIEVSPPLPSLSFAMTWDGLEVFGGFLPSTRYTIRVKPGLRDIYGQTMARTWSRTFNTEPAEPYLEWAHNGLAVLEAAFDPLMSLLTVNEGRIRLRVYPVPPQFLLRGGLASAGYHAERRKLLAEWGLKPVEGQRLPKAKRNWVTETRVSLASALGGRKHGWVLVDADPGGNPDDERYRTALIQYTDLAVTAAFSDDSVQVLVTRLSDGSQVEGAEISLLEPSMPANRADPGPDTRVLQTSRTDALGHATLPSPRHCGSTVEGPFYVMAQVGDDAAFLPLLDEWHQGFPSGYLDVPKPDQPVPPVALVFTDRPLYRPAETVHGALLVRIADPGAAGDLRPPAPDRRKCSFSVKSPKGAQVASGNTELSDFGMGSFDFQLSREAPLGTYHVSLDCLGDNAAVSFKVEEYRTPEFRTAATWEDKGQNALVYQDASTLVRGDYLFGAPMAGAEVRWTLTETETEFAPPGNPGFTFSDIMASDLSWPTQYPHTIFGRSYEGPHGSGRLDENGMLRIPLKLDPSKPERHTPRAFKLDATILDATNQVAESSATLIAHWAERMVGVSPERMLVHKDQAVEVAAVVTDLKGNRYSAADVHVELVEPHWTPKPKEDSSESWMLASPRQVSSDHIYSEESVGQCDLVANETPGRCSLVPPHPGLFLVRALTRDAKGRVARSATPIHVLGDAPDSAFPSRGTNLIQDKPLYEPGDTATVLVRTDLLEASGLAIVGREGVVRSFPLQVHGGTASFQVPIEERFMPGVDVLVHLTAGRSGPPSDKAFDFGLPDMDWARAKLRVSTEGRRLRVAISPSTLTALPGSEMRLKLHAVDAAGKPARASVALAVVDEGVLALAGFQLPNPLEALYRQLWANVAFATNISMVVPQWSRLPLVPGDPESLPYAFGSETSMRPRMKRTSSYMTLGSMGQEDDTIGDPLFGAPGFALRQFFYSTAYFNASLVTDSNGDLEVAFKLPDNLTEYRVYAVAADETVRFGASESRFHTQQAVMARPALPRFLHEGDTFDAAVAVTNLTGSNTEVLVKASAEGAEVESGPERVAVAAGHSVQVRFPAKATRAGSATFQFAVVALTRQHPTDAARVTIPVLAPAPSETTVSAGETQGFVTLPFQVPIGSAPDSGGMSIRLSATALLGLEDALSYVLEYPYDCTEQISSRILAALALEPILPSLGVAGLDSSQKVHDWVQQLLVRLVERQRNSGGFGYWSRSGPTDLFVSSYALLALDAASGAGYRVPHSSVERTARFLRQSLAGYYAGTPDAASKALALLALVRGGHSNAKVREYIGAEVSKALRGPDTSKEGGLPLFALAWLAEALHTVSPKSTDIASLLGLITRRPVVTATAVHFAEGASASSGC